MMSYPSSKHILLVLFTNHCSDMEEWNLKDTPHIQYMDLF